MGDTERVAHKRDAPYTAKLQSSSFSAAGTQLQPPSSMWLRRRSLNSTYIEKHDMGQVTAYASVDEAFSLRSETFSVTLDLTSSTLEVMVSTAAEILSCWSIFAEMP